MSKTPVSQPIPDSPKVRQHVHERLHQVDLRISPRSRSPPLVTRVVVVPLQLDPALVEDQRERLYDLFRLGITFCELSRGKCVEWEERVQDAVQARNGRVRLILIYSRTSRQTELTRHIRLAAVPIVQR